MLRLPTLKGTLTRCALRQQREPTMMKQLTGMRTTTERPTRTTCSTSTSSSLLTEQVVGLAEHV